MRCGLRAISRRHRQGRVAVPHTTSAVLSIAPPTKLQSRLRIAELPIGVLCNVLSRLIISSAAALAKAGTAVRRALWLCSWEKVQHQIMMANNDLANSADLDTVCASEWCCPRGLCALYSAADKLGHVILVESSYSAWWTLRTQMILRRELVANVKTRTNEHSRGDA